MLPAALCYGIFLRYSTHTAMSFGNSGAHGSHIALCRLPSEASGEGGSDQSDQSDQSDWSDILCPQYRHCAKCPANQ